MTAPKGSTVHLDLSTPTTSRCAIKSSAREGSGTALEERRATRKPRPGVLSKISDEMPSLVRMAAIYFAATSSLPGGLVVSMRSRPCSQPSASAWICESEGLAAGAYCGDVGTDCARPGAAENRNAMRTNIGSGKRARAMLDFPQKAKFTRRANDQFILSC